MVRSALARFEVAAVRDLHVGGRRVEVQRAVGRIGDEVAGDARGPGARGWERLHRPRLGHTVVGGRRGDVDHGGGAGRVVERPPRHHVRRRRDAGDRADRGGGGRLGRGVRPRPGVRLRRGAGAGRGGGCRPRQGRGRPGRRRAGRGRRRRRRPGRRRRRLGRRRAGGGRRRRHRPGRRRMEHVGERALQRGTGVEVEDHLVVAGLEAAGGADGGADDARRCRSRD